MNANRLTWQRLRQSLNQPEAWQRTLVIMFVAQFATAVGFSTIFPFLPLYVADLGSSTALSIEFLAAAVFSVQALTMAIASPIWGVVADRYGRKLMVERAMFGGTVILLMMGFVQNAEQLVLLRAIQGFITGTVAAANALVASVVPRERMGFGMGLLLMGQVSGLSLGPLIGGLMADAVGYRYSFVITSFLLLSAGILVYFGVTENFVPPAEMGKTGLKFWQKWRHVLTSPHVKTVYSLRFLSNLGRMILIPFAPLFIATLLVEDGRLNTITGLAIGISAATGTVTAVYFGRLGDRIGHRRVLIGCALATSLLYFPQSQVTAAWQLVVLLGLTGAASGGIVPSISALLARLTQTEEAGSAYGLDNSIVAASRAIAPFIGSVVIMLFNLRAAFVAAAVVYLLVAVAAVRLLAATDMNKPG